MSAVERLARNAYESAKRAANAVEGEPRFFLGWEETRPSIRAGWIAAARYCTRHFRRRRP